MAWNDLVTEGSYALVTDEAYPRLRKPVFTFRATDVPKVKAFLANHYVHFEVRWRDDNRMAYFMSAPDISDDTVSIVVPSSDHIWIQSGHALDDQHKTLIVDDRGGELAMDTFTKSVAHDWTQIYAEADKCLRLSETAGDKRDDYIEAAMKGMKLYHADLESYVAQSHQLYGRLWQMKGELEMARHHLALAVRLAVRRGTDALLPSAAGPLLDLALALEASKDAAAAKQCLLHALSVRPNYPAALAALAQLSSDDEAIVSTSLARLAALGTREALLRSTARIVGEASGRSPEALVTAAEKDAARVDLATNPFALPGRGSLERLEVEAGLAEPPPPDVEDELAAKGYRDAPGVVAEPAEEIASPISEPPSPPESEKRPWWKIW